VARQKPGSTRSSEVAVRLTGRRKRGGGGEVVIPANGAGRGPVEAGPFPEDEAAGETPGRLHAQPLSRLPEREGNVGKVIGDLLLRDPATRPESSWAVRGPSRRWRRSASRTVIERSAGGRSRRVAAAPPGYGILARSGSGRSGKPTCSSGGGRRIHVRHRGHAGLVCPPRGRVLILPCRPPAALPARRGPLWFRRRPRSGPG
jgi:hypothetical protein